MCFSVFVQYNCVSLQGGRLGERLQKMQINKELMTAFSPIWFSNTGSNIFPKARANTYCCSDHTFSFSFGTK